MRIEDYFALNILSTDLDYIAAASWCLFSQSKLSLLVWIHLVFTNSWSHRQELLNISKNSQALYRFPVSCFLLCWTWIAIHQWQRKPLWKRCWFSEVQGAQEQTASKKLLAPQSSQMCAWVHIQRYPGTLKILFSAPFQSRGWWETTKPTRILRAPQKLY